MPGRTRNSSPGPVIAALVLALCCAAPVVIGIVAASGLGVVLATLGPPVGLGVVIAGVAVTVARRRLAKNAARDVSQK